MSLFKKVLFRLSANEPVQRLLEFNVRAAQYLMGIGAGSSADSSGERVLVRALLAGHAGRDTPLTIFDVGANQGQFLTLIRKGLRGRPAHIHAFEPGSRAFEVLRERWDGNPDVTLNNAALGRTAEERDLFFDEPGSGIASMYRRRLDHLGREFDQSERIQVDTLDRYCEARRVKAIDLLKMDVEGNELEVLQGSLRMLGSRAIRMLSFEFGGCNIDSRTFLQDFFYLLKAHGMGRMFRITPGGYLMPVDRYQEILEQFRTTNFVAMHS
jgi:FkbM family methyltransferase